MEDAGEWTIVLMDDEADIREITAITLEDAGYRVHTAPDGAEGLALCEQVSPRIVITDIRMPKVDGLAVLAALKERRPEVEVIVVTAFGEMDTAIAALRLDASDFITKPIANEALHLALQRARDRYNGRKQLKEYTALLERSHARTLAELIRSVTFRNNLIESSLDGIMACDGAERIAVFNRSMGAITGYDPSQVLSGWKLSRFFKADEMARLKKALGETGAGGKDRLFLHETQLRGKNETAVPVQLSATLLPEENGTAGMVLILRDLREIRRLEQEMADQARILHQDKMMSLGRLAASVVHEINNPLSGILNYLRLMSRIIGRGTLSEARQEKFSGYLDIVEKETARCSEIISGLLTFSRKSPPVFGTVRIDEVLKRSILLSRHKLELQNIKLETDIPENLPPIPGDANSLQQCVINLIFNGIDAMPEGGRLVIRARHDPEGKQIHMTVSDTGRGIPEDQMERIFEPFFTTKKEGYGVGLGLSTAYGIVERHRGTIRARNRTDRTDRTDRTGRGTEFIITLPTENPNGAAEGRGDAARGKGSVQDPSK